MFLLGFLQGIGPGEILLVLVVVLLLFGGSRLADAARSLGRARGEFSRGAEEVERDRELERLQREARDLGIDPTGKTPAQIRSEIATRKPG